MAGGQKKDAIALEIGILCRTRNRDVDTLRTGLGRGRQRMLALEALLRLAWQADRDGRVNRRDALLTLAAAEAPADAPWRECCRLRLARSRPDHPFATFPSLTAALADSRVTRGLRKLRDSYLPGRLRSLLALDAIRRGPFTGNEP